LTENLNDKDIPRFIDIKYSEEKKLDEVDMEAQNLLNELKNNKLTSKLNPKTNIFKFQVTLTSLFCLFTIQFSFISER
jgi:hypothetical protein